MTRLKSDRTRPSTTTLKRIAEVFEVRLDDLVDNKLPVPKALSQDQQLLEKIEQIQELDGEDRAVVFHMHRQPGHPQTYDPHAGGSEIRLDTADPSSLHHGGRPGCAVQGGARQASRSSRDWHDPDGSCHQRSVQLSSSLTNSVNGAKPASCNASSHYLARSDEVRILQCYGHHRHGAEAATIDMVSKPGRPRSECQQSWSGNSVPISCSTALCGRRSMRSLERGRRIMLGS